jgi:transposase
MVLGFSRALFAEVVTQADLDTFLELHVHAFRALGGMPEEILYDNQKVVVLGRRSDGPIYHPALLAFAGQFGFRPRLCRPYRAKTKGKVERSIGYVRDRFFCGRTFIDVADLNHQLEGWLATHANMRFHRTTGERPCDRLLREKLLPFAAARPWRSVQTPVVLPRPPSFRFASPEVERRSLSVYEEVCQ